MKPLYEASLRLSGSTLLLYSLVDTNTLFSANPIRYMSDLEVDRAAMTLDWIAQFIKRLIYIYITL